MQSKVLRCKFLIIPYIKYLIGSLKEISIRQSSMTYTQLRIDLLFPSMIQITSTLLRTGVLVIYCKDTLSKGMCPLDTMYLFIKRDVWNL